MVECPGGDDASGKREGRTPGRYQSVVSNRFEWGGNACWEIATQYPETFAAMAVVCGMTPVPYAHWISKSMPIWVFHGTDDPVIPFSESEEMVRKLKEMGYDAQLTAYKGVGHNAWEKAYQEERLYTWFLSHSR